MPINALFVTKMCTPSLVVHWQLVAPAPNCNLNHHVDKEIKIGFLINGNLSVRVFGRKNELIGLKNTCNFDALAQVN